MTVELTAEEVAFLVALMSRLNFTVDDVENHLVAKKLKDKLDKAQATERN